MLEKSKLLKVMSILVIIGGVFSIILGVLTIGISQSVPELAEQLTTGSIVMSFVGAVIELAAGITGLMRKSFMASMVCGVLMVVIAIVNMFSVGFQITGLLSLIVPVLYIWAVYMAKAE